MVEPSDLKRGDPTAWRHAVEQLSPRLNAFARRLCGDPDLAEDIVQEAWITAFRKRDTLQQSSRLLGWLLAICRSVFLSNERTASRRSALFAAQSDPAACAGEPPLIDARLAKAIASLTDRQRDVLLLRLAEGMSTRETGQRLGIAEGTVKATLHRALRIMREQLAGGAS